MNNLLKKVIIVTISLLLTKNAAIFSGNIPTSFQFALDTSLLSQELQQFAPCTGYAPVTIPLLQKNIIITEPQVEIIGPNIFVQCSSKGVQPINANLTIKASGLPARPTLSEISSYFPNYLGAYKDPRGYWYIFSAPQ